MHHFFTVFLLIFFVVSCSFEQNKQNQTPEKIGELTTDYQWLQSNLFNKDCVKCHSSGINLTNYNSLLNYIKPGSPSESLLYKAISSGKMPPFVDGAS